MYSQEEISAALKLYHQCKSATETVRTLGYPTHRTLYTWIHNEDKPKPKRKKLLLINTVEHPRNPSVQIKIDAIHRCFELGESVKSVSEDIGYSRASIYAWRKRYLQKGMAALMNEKNISPHPLKEGSSSANPEVEELKAQMFDMQLELDILKETINVLKKDPGIDQTALKNREKAVIVDALKNRYSLPLLLEKLGLSRSCYYYHESSFRRPDKYAVLRKRITEMFRENMECYGYRRIHGLLKKEKIIVSEKIIRRIMKEEDLSVKTRKRKKYNSYLGEITPAVPNIIQRDFHAERPNQKWLTDITEFALPAGKVYLSPIVDCFDGMLPAWKISTTPDAALVNDMLDEAVRTLNKMEHPLVHTDRGCHYRWSGWISRMEQSGLERSMSQKGCSPDNSACEGLFGRLKNEMFYNKNWQGVSIPQFIEHLEQYLIWYNEKRIKVSLGNMSPMEYRRSLGLTV